MSSATVDNAPPSSVLDDEITRFARLAEQWWDENGPFAPLHAIGPARIGYIRDQAAAHFGRAGLRPLEGLSLVDIGCGGGLIAEPMCRLGASVTGIDAAEAGVRAAALHAEQSGLSIDYQCTTAEALAAQGKQFDIVLALEIVEHVADPQDFIATCVSLVKPGGLLVCSTLNRTPKAYATAIIGAEYVMRWLPRGTHDWQKFLRPSELAAMVERGGGNVSSMTGLAYRPFARKWELDTKDLSVNYLLSAVRPG